MKEHVLTGTDTLEGISAQYGVPVCMIIRANGLAGIGRLQNARTLQIPGRCYCIRQNEAVQEQQEANVPFFEYEVRDGENILDIARRYHTTLNILARLNNILDPLLLEPGQRLKILKLPENCEMYSVKTSDYMEGLVRRFNIPERCIRAYNCLKANDAIYPGMQLMIPR